MSLTPLRLCDRGDGLGAQHVFGFGLMRSCAILCAGAAVEPFVSGWFYGVDTLSFHFRVSAWFFLFHLVCSLAALALASAILFCFLFLSPLFLSFVPVLDPLAASMVAMLWSWDSLQAYSFLPFRLDLSGLGVGVSSQSLELLFWLFLDPFILCS